MRNSWRARPAQLGSSLPNAQRAHGSAPAGSPAHDTGFRSSPHIPLPAALHETSQEPPRFGAAELSAVAILSTDPYDRSRIHKIKKLEGVPAGEGQYRLALGRWRFRYDIMSQVVLLSYYGLRREDTY